MERTVQDDAGSGRAVRPEREVPAPVRLRRLVHEVLAEVVLSTWQVTSGKKKVNWSPAFAGNAIYDIIRADKKVGMPKEKST